jgi:hypothetical protein
MIARAQNLGKDDTSVHAPTDTARQPDALREPPVSPLSALVKLLARQAAREAFMSVPHKDGQQ